MFNLNDAYFQQSVDSESRKILTIDSDMIGLNITLRWALGVKCEL